jgi:hypothetical protein
VKARQLIDGASYDPEQVKALGQAFDRAWDRMAPSIASRPEAVEDVRRQLADVILSFAEKGQFEPNWLSDTAVLVMLTRLSD